MSAAFWNGILRDHAEANTLAARLSGALPETECPRCNGFGEIDVSDQCSDRCPKCAGSGVVWDDRAEAEGE